MKKELIEATKNIYKSKQELKDLVENQLGLRPNKTETYHNKKDFWTIRMPVSIPVASEIDAVTSKMNIFLRPYGLSVSTFEPNIFLGEGMGHLVLKSKDNASSPFLDSCRLIEGHHAGMWGRIKSITKEMCHLYRPQYYDRKDLGLTGVRTSFCLRRPISLEESPAKEMITAVEDFWGIPFCKTRSLEFTFPISTDFIFRLDLTEY